MSFRKSVGNRIHVARFYRHNGNTDESGQPTYENESDWLPVGIAWPCEFLSTTGGERIRGRQATERTTHLLYGYPEGIDEVDPKCRCKLSDNWYEVVAALDTQGLNREARIELRREE